MGAAGGESLAKGRAALHRRTARPGSADRKWPITVRALTATCFGLAVWVLLVLKLHLLFLATS